jgi:hypothetical protein
LNKTGCQAPKTRDERPFAARLRANWDNSRLAIVTPSRHARARAITGDKVADNQSLNATFFAFRKREQGGVLLRATLAYLLVAFVIYGVFAYFNWQGVIDYFQWSMTMSESAAQADPADPNAVFASMMPPASVMSLMPAYFLLMLFSYFLLAAWEAACLRWMIHGEVKGFMGLALDADTLRIYFTYWLWLFLFMAIYIVFLIVMLGLGVGVALSFSEGGDAGAMGATALIVVVAAFAVLFGFIYFGVRFAPAGATSIARRRFAFFDAWKVTKGRFWALFGSYVLLFLMYFVGIIILSVIAGLAMGFGVFGQMQSGAEPQSPEEVFALFASPAVWIPAAICYGLMIVGVFLFYLALFGVNARAAQAALEEGKIQAAG